MAYYYGINKGASEATAAVGTSTNSTDVEIVVNATNVTDRQSLLISLERLVNFILQQNYPPA